MEGEAGHMVRVLLITFWSLLPLPYVLQSSASGVLLATEADGSVSKLRGPLLPCELLEKCSNASCLFLLFFDDDFGKFLLYFSLDDPRLREKRDAEGKDGKGGRSLLSEGGGGAQ